MGAEGVNPRKAQTADVPADPKRVVAEGYDRIGGRYAAWAATIRDDARETYTRELVESLPAGADVLELGCGSGAPTLARLAERFRVTGVDLSERQIEAARRSVPGATLLQADMASLGFPAASFDAVVSFYAITHVPRAEHARLFAAIARWLRPGGLFVASLGAHASDDAIEPDWLGVPMFFSHFGATEYERMLHHAGFATIRASIEETIEDGVAVPFWWVLAKRAG